MRNEKKTKKGVLESGKWKKFIRVKGAQKIVFSTSGTVPLKS